MLWPEKRAKDALLRRQGAGHHRPDHGAQLAHHPDRLPCPSCCVTLLEPFRDDAAAAGRRATATSRSARSRRARRSACSRTSTCGPTAMSLVDQRQAQRQASLKLLVKAERDLRSTAPTDAERCGTARQHFAELCVEPMLELSKCPDFVVNRGHYFGTDRFDRGAGLSDDEQERTASSPELATTTGTRCIGSEMTADRRRTARATMRLRLCRRRLRRRRRHGGGAAGRGRLQGAACSRPAAIPGCSRAACAACATRTACPTTTTCRPSTPSPRRTRRCAGTSSSATTPTTRPQRRDPKYRSECDGQPVDGVLYPRAGTLGGCTAHNAMILVCPHDADWDQIADETGDPSWSRREHAALLPAARAVPPPAAAAACSTMSGSTAPGTAGTAGCRPRSRCPAAPSRDRQLMSTIVLSAETALADSGRPLAAPLAGSCAARGDPNDRDVVQAQCRRRALHAADHPRSPPRRRARAAARGGRSAIRTG